VRIRSAVALAGVGCEWIIDATGCDPARLASLEAMRTLFARLIALLDLNAVAEPQWHSFPGLGEQHGGVTGVCLLAESHLAVHTFPEHRSLCLNVFCCKPRPEWNVAEELEPLLGGDGFSVRVQRVERDYRLHTPHGRGVGGGDLRRLG
jgi:S-adenosylmethionine decarboxylase